MPRSSGGGRGTGDDDIVHTPKYLLAADQDDLFGCDGVAWPAVIGAGDDGDWDEES